MLGRAVASCSWQRHSRDVSPRTRGGTVWRMAAVAEQGLEVIHTKGCGGSERASLLNLQRERRRPALAGARELEATSPGPREGVPGQGQSPDLEAAEPEAEAGQLCGCMDDLLTLQRALKAPEAATEKGRMTTGSGHKGHHVPPSLTTTVPMASTEQISGSSGLGGDAACKGTSWVQPPRAPGTPLGLSPAAHATCCLGFSSMSRTPC